jgi:choline-sulfatase
MSESTPCDTRPNIVVIMSDEHDPGVTGCYGDGVVETPNLDRLASEGVIFDGCYTTSPLCVPARLSFTAGKYISRCGAWNNDCWLPSENYPSIAGALGSVGYESYLCGKQHYDRTRRYGFEDILPEIGSNGSRKTGRGGRRRADDTHPNTASWESRSSEFYPGDDSIILEHDRMVTNRACDFLRRRPRGGSPFFLFVGHLAPHFPLISPGDIYEKYRGRVPMPEIPEDLIESLPFNYQQLRYGFGTNNTDADVVRKGRELYWALVDWYDGQVGQVMDAVRNSGAAENTLIFYTSDHGENKGDHGLWWKNNMYEHASRIPLIAWQPTRWRGGQRRAGACSLVDLVQTIASLAGAETPDDWDGDSMLPWLDDTDTRWKDEALSEYYGHNIASGMTMYRTGTWKYIYHNRADAQFGPVQELYNLDTDPKELHNLAADTEHADRLQHTHASMVNELRREPDTIEAQCRTDYARGYERELRV